MASFAGAAVLAGCGSGEMATDATTTGTTATLNGRAFGGPNPISGATITIWSTGNVNTSNGTVTSQGYGVGTALQTTTTAADGTFTFAGGYTCPAGQYAYVTSGGGNTGAGTNSAAVLAAALGPCSSLYSGTTYTGGFIFMNELTTVAAAYALGSFTTVTGNGSTAVVSIGAPATNNAATASTTAASGLGHAFQNAIDLVNTFANNSSANLTPPANSSALVPTRVINTIADSLIACINSTGVTSSPCSTVFGATGTSTTSNTFQAMVNLSKNPSLAGSGFTTADFLNASSPSLSIYSPNLTSAPADYSLAVIYPKGLGAGTGVQGLQYPMQGALDVNDNYYLGNADASTPTKFNAVSFNANGALASILPDNSTTVTPAGASVDLNGNLNLLGTALGGAFVRYAITPSSGTIGTTPTTTATVAATEAPVDSATDLAGTTWIVTSATSPNAGHMYGYKSGATTTSWSKPFAAGFSGGVVAVDLDQNVWLTRLGGTNTLAVFPNTGTIANPKYASSNAFVTATIPGSNSEGITFSTLNTPYTGYVTSSTGTPGITPVTRNSTGVTVTSLTAGSEVTGNFSAPTEAAVDGDGTIWVADGTKVTQFPTGGTTGFGYKPCNTSTSTCPALPYSGLNSVSIDSTGTIWFTASVTGEVGQMIGAASPTWPLLSEGVLARP